MRRFQLLLWLLNFFQFRNTLSDYLYYSLILGQVQGNISRMITMVLIHTLPYLKPSEFNGGGH